MQARTTSNIRIASRPWTLRTFRFRMKSDRSKLLLPTKISRKLSLKILKMTLCLTLKLTQKVLSKWSLSNNRIRLRRLRILRLLTLWLWWEHFLRLQTPKMIPQKLSLIFQHSLPHLIKTLHHRKFLCSNNSNNSNSKTYKFLNLYLLWAIQIKKCLRQ